jgi:hypothetical protein
MSDQTAIDRERMARLAEMHEHGKCDHATHVDDGICGDCADDTAVALRALMAAAREREQIRQACIAVGMRAETHLLNYIESAFQFLGKSLERAKVSEATIVSLRAEQGRLQQFYDRCEVFARTVWTSKQNVGNRLRNMADFMLDDLRTMRHLDATAAIHAADPLPAKLRALKRYDFVQVNACYTTDHQMESSDDGEWVRYDAVEDLLASRPSSPPARS